MPFNGHFGASRGSGAVWALNLLPCLCVHGQVSHVGAEGSTRCKQLPFPLLPLFPHPSALQYPLALGTAGCVSAC